MSQEIGVAYVSLLPSGKGFSKGVQNEAESAFKGAEKSSNGFFSNVATWAKRGALVVGGMVAAVGALAIGGGISRALNIEDATAKLKGLGHDTQVVESIMKDALASVKGTAFGLDAAATTAASAVAAGIKPGQELERYLRLTADAATIAGVSMEEMGSIINQVTSKGYAGMENLNRLTERGIPIMQWLQDEYGVTADELQKMVSRGEVDSETFRRAIENNIGGAALESGNTTRGAFANMLASLSRLGEGFAGPALGAARDFFNEITTVTDGIKTQLGPAFADLQHWVDGLDFKFAEQALTFITPLTEAIDHLSEAARDNSLGSWIKKLAQFSPTLAIAMEAASALSPLLPVFKILGDEIAPVLAEAFKEIAAELEPVIPLLAESLTDAIIQLAPPLTDLLLALIPLLPPLIQLAVETLPALTAILAGILPVLVPVIGGITGFYTVVSDLLSLFTGSTAVQDFGAHLATAEGPIYDITRAIADFIMSALGWLITTISQVVANWEAGWSRISSFFSGIGSTIGGTAYNIWGTLTSIFSTGVAQVGSIFSALPRHIQNVFAGAGAWLISSGRALMQGFIDGITSMIGAVGSAVGGVMEWAAGFFPHSPADRGPFSGTGWSDVFGGGEALMEQFAYGAESFKPQLSFANLTGLVGVSSSQEFTMPSELVVRDVNDQLVGRMGVEAASRIGFYDGAANGWTRGGVRD